MSYHKKQELPTFASTRVHPRVFLVGSVLLIFFSFLCCVVLCYVFVLFVFVFCLVCPMLSVSLDGLSSSCVLCAQCCQCLWMVCLRPVSCVPNVVCVSGWLAFVLCLVCPMLSVSLDGLSSSCILCTQCCQCLWMIVHSGLTLRFSLTFAYIIMKQ